MSHPEAIQQLLDEHDRLRELLAEARQRLSRLIEAGASSLDGGTESFFADLDAFLAVDLEAHIAKEEEELFPPLERRSEDLRRVCEDMVVQHDEIKARRSGLQRVLEHLASGHDDVRAAVHAARAVFNGEGRGPLRTLFEAVFRLDAMLQGHFDDEEGELSPAAEEVLTPNEFAAMIPMMAAIEARTFE